jgi:hypothetical protein
MLRAFVEYLRRNLKRIRRSSVLVVGVGGVGRRIEGKIALIREGLELLDTWVECLVVGLPSFGGVGIKKGTWVM